MTRLLNKVNLVKSVPRMGKYADEFTPFLQEKRSTQVNVAHRNKFIGDFSNFPIITSDYDVDIQLLNNFIVGVSPPSLESDFIVSTALRQERHHNVDKGNGSLGTLNVKMKCSENHENYWLLRKVVWDRKFGLRPKDLKNLVDYDIEQFTHTILDNQKRPIVRNIFKDCQLAGISAIDNDYTSSDEIEFDLTLRFHHFEMIYESLFLKGT